MASTTYTKISTVLVTSATSASIVFSDIPQTYTDLAIFYSLRDSFGTGSNYYIDETLTVNSQTAAHLRYVYTNSGTTLGGTGTAGSISVAATGTGATANTFSNSFMYISEYTSSAVKTFTLDQVSENNGNSNLITLSGGTITNGTGITTITLTAYGSFLQNSMGTLYGIKNT